MSFMCVMVNISAILKSERNTVKITRFSPVNTTLFLIVLTGCSADYRVHCDLRAAYDELVDGNLITFDYNFPSSHNDHLVVSDGGSVSFPASVADASLRKKQDGITMVLESWAEYPDGSGTSYPLGSSLPITESHTYYAQWTVIGGIGPAGGIVVYDNHVVNNGWRYLEMAVGAGSEYSSWPWSTPASPYVDTSTSIGEGKRNTFKAITNEYYENGVVLEASLYTHDGFKDWFLPSINELLLAEPFLPDDVPYWSSSLYSTPYVYVLEGTTSNHSHQQSDSIPHARPFRAFKDEHPTVSVFYVANSLDATGDPPADYNVYKAYDASDAYEDEEAIIVKDQGTLERSGYDFAGWSAIPTGGILATEGVALYSAEDFILYAQWIPE